jgi:hypothetical protein
MWAIVYLYTLTSFNKISIIHVCESSEFCLEFMNVIDVGENLHIGTE